MNTLVHVLLAFLAGCAGYDPGGPMMSIDQHTYDSTPDRPQTVTLSDHTTGQALWTMPIPIGSKLVIQFRKGENKTDPVRPDVMHWEVMPIDQYYKKVLDNAMPVPPSYMRILHAEVRTAAPAQPS